MTDPGPVAVETAALRRLLLRLFGTVGAPAGNAEAVVDHLVEASVMGVPSHGVMRVPSYLAAVEEGRVDPAARPVVADDRGARVVLDGNRSFGPVAGTAACAEAVARATAGAGGGRGGGGPVADDGEPVAGGVGPVAGGVAGGPGDRGSGGGVSVVSVRGAGHLGRIGAYTEALAAAGLVGLGFCSLPPSDQNVAWAGARVGRLGTNPVAFAFPTSGDPVAADLSTSATSEGRVRLAWNEGRTVGEGLIRDGHGRPTTDPERFFADPPGTLEPLGGPERGHKGSALALMVEAMATLLAGEAVDDAARGSNLTLVAIVPPPGFAALADGLVAHVHAAEPVTPGEPVLVPGERARTARRTATAVVVDGTSWCAIRALAERLGLPVPPTADVTS